jgi:DHA1 family bicyclomycin/chloramphenicol resistance-like MFS transporter
MALAAAQNKRHSLAMSANATPTSTADMPFPPSPGCRSIGFAEFVGIVALMMGMTAYSVDNLLPAFDALRDSFAPTRTRRSCSSTAT